MIIHPSWPFSHTDSEPQLELPALLLHASFPFRDLYLKRTEAKHALLN